MLHQEENGATCLSLSENGLTEDQDDDHDDLQ
jgi:hypothetical protein